MLLLVCQVDFHLREGILTLSRELNLFMETQKVTTQGNIQHYGKR